MATLRNIKANSILFRGTVVGLILAGCVTLGNGKVSKVVSNTEADVTTTDDNLATGDAVKLYTQGKYISRQGYETKKLGEGKVISVSNNTARVKLDGDSHLMEESGVIFASKIGTEKQDPRFESGRSK